MMSRPFSQANFMYVIAQPEAKPLLVSALERVHPGLRLAYSRPGLYSFKAPEPELPLDFRAQVPFARHDGFALGAVKDRSTLTQWLAPLRSALRLHVFARDAGEGKPRATPEAVERCRRALLDSHPSCFNPEGTPAIGDWVLDVILPPDVPSRSPSLAADVAATDADAATEPWFVGYHRHDASRSPLPGSVARRAMPETAPSRAWSKLEEATDWANLPLRAGDVAVEIGCAPGGAVMALVDRGLEVVGIDPAAMDPRLMAHCTQIQASFRHIAQPVAAVTREFLPKRVDWLLSDANLAPQVVLRTLSHWCKWLRPQLRGVVFTMKLNDRRVADALPQLIARVGEFGLGEPRAVQLPSHRQEVVVIATRKRR
ncbi:MAG TPA: SAM-dependent methyltransferase [Polyangiaceae bacterium]